MTSRLLMASLILLGACSAAPPKSAPETPGVGMANPASVHCGRQGGRTEIRRGEAGEYGVCVLPDGRQCEEWALFRDGRCVAPTAKAAE